MTELLIYQTAALVLGFIVDFFVGDPYVIPHPVVAIGKLIALWITVCGRGTALPATSAAAS